ncbi:MAG: exo-alpha-sialidase [Candidatus Kapabacteria bacterium]|nr:exo-alpha-sialidase [Candidatus Kapabacteria bacterium]
MPRFSRDQRKNAKLGPDSLAWIATGRTTSNPDTLWMCHLSDTTRFRFDTSITVRGLPGIINLRTVRLRSTGAGRLYMISSDDWYAEWLHGQWVLRDSVPGISAASANVQYTPLMTVNRTSAKELEYSKVDLTRDSTQVQQGAIRPGFFVSLGEGFKSISDSLIQVYHIAESRPIALVRGDGEVLWLNELCRDLEPLKVIPTLLGFTDSSENAVVVGPHDMAIVKEAGRPGLVRASAVRGETHFYANLHGPRIQSRRGLRTPFIGESEVIMPGTTVKQLSRDGRYMATLHDGPATAVLRMRSTELIVADSCVIRVFGSGDSVSFDLSRLDTTSSAGTGFVSSMTEMPDGSVVAFVNGMEIWDNESLENKPYRGGFIAHSTDKGRTWKRSSQPLESPYFLGHLLLPDGSIVASATRVVRDTAPVKSDDQAPPLETKNHSALDHFVVRSADMGRSWNLVHTSYCSTPYRLLGGNGVVEANGTLILLANDGVLGSKDNGLTWELYDVPGIPAGTYVISMFQYEQGKRVYYCTSTGVYGTRVTSGVEQNSGAAVSTVTDVGHLAMSWQEHLNQWQRSDLTLLALYTLTGERIQVQRGITGTYVAHLSTGSATLQRLILVLND